MKSRSEPDADTEFSLSSQASVWRKPAETPARRAKQKLGHSGIRT
jgi:hypothetical protein